MMLNLTGAVLDLTETDFLAIRYASYTHFVKLRHSDADVFRALHTAMTEEMQSQRDRAAQTANARQAMAASNAG
jgi:hypothetical protein